MNRIDLGARLAVALARPLSTFVGSSREAVVRYMRGPHTTVHDVGVGAAVRCAAWLFMGVLFLGLGAVAAAAEDIANVGGTVSGLVWPPMAVCLLTGIFSAIRAGIAWYVSEERWDRAGQILRWVVTPGNRDVIGGMLIILVGVLVASA